MHCWRKKKQTITYYLFDRQWSTSSTNNQSNYKKFCKLISEVCTRTQIKQKFIFVMATSSTVLALTKCHLKQIYVKEWDHNQLNQVNRSQLVIFCYATHIRHAWHPMYCSCCIHWSLTHFYKVHQIVLKLNLGCWRNASIAKIVSLHFASMLRKEF